MEESNSIHAFHFHLKLLYNPAIMSGSVALGISIHKQLQAVSWQGDFDSNSF